VLFKQKKNKRFNYNPRFQDSKEQESKDALETKWNLIKNGSQRKKNRFLSLPVLIIMLAALFILIYILNGYIK